MNTARSGRDRENKLKRYLEEILGWRCIRAAASKGDFDLIGIDATGNELEIHLLQIKGRDWPSGEELDRLLALTKLEGLTTTVSVVRFRKGSSIVDWVDMYNIENKRSKLKSIPWILWSRQIDLRPDQHVGYDA